MMLDDQLSQEQLVNQIKTLHKQIEEFKNDKEDLEILLETITEHSTDLENEIYEKNQIMLKYLQQVKLVTEAAAAVESESFTIDSLNDVAAREDELGQLARVFQNMAKQVEIRETKLRQQVQELRIEIDKGKQAKQVADIVQTDSFKNLKQKLKRIKDSRKS
ncbi:histidine kinase [Crocosphaera sp. UHCC 0190]|uniref:histidine kinase n=1 Tax=Crocosphaera sp. UHCC 0190 TaxID=3110246 RepID=UPI002B20C1EF|nr:histidine kinase [Crocosphaera sp. UHCC 0190]MEA5510469.1 histidine kinase [Crocosphaera sp. UHCC 0190]